MDTEKAKALEAKFKELEKIQNKEKGRIKNGT